MAAVSYFVRMVAKDGKADQSNEFWLYETWASEEAVEAHESGEAFLRYKEALRPLVEADSVLFGNTVPVKVLGYRLRDAR